jgi:BASS family bile acid:Na+ symporter
MVDWVNVLVILTLITMMVALGLGVTLVELAAVMRNRHLLARALAANYVCVPAATVALLLLFEAPPLVAAGFLILAVCPGAPFGPPCTALARGSVLIAVGLMVVLAASSALLAPLLLLLLMPLVAGDQALDVEPARLLGTLAVTQLAPLCAGLALRQARPGLAQRLCRPANLLSSVLSVLTVAAVLVAQFHTLAEIRLRGLAGMGALLVASLGAGWWLGGRDRDERKALTVTTALRNVGVGLVIANGAFAGTAAVTAAVAYGLFEIFGTLGVAAAWGRRAPSTPAVMR